MKFLLLLALSGLPHGRGKATVEKVCSSCHPAEVVLQNRNTPKGWTELVDEMIFQGAKATPRERREIIDYLAKNFPLTL
jgi:cytochrome c2